MVITWNENFRKLTTSDQSGAEISKQKYCGSHEGKDGQHLLFEWHDDNTTSPESGYFFEKAAKNLCWSCTHVEMILLASGMA